jgi:hypothetical protein
MHVNLRVSVIFFQTAELILNFHSGGSTEEAQAAIGVDVAGKLISYINNGRTLGAVNFPEVDLPLNPNTLRLLNIHRNVPGVLRVRCKNIIKASNSLPPSSPSELVSFFRF